MSTVILHCTNCSKEFPKSSYEISRRKAKSRCSEDRWFCSRSCSASYSNKNREHNPGPGPQRGNEHNLKWDPNISWYIKRMSGDRRSKCLLEGSKQDIHDHLISIWDGLCSVTKMPITRRDYRGQISTDNPFIIASIDRIDNNKPYGIGNVRWTCLAVNLARQSLPADTFDRYYREFSSILL